MTTTQPRTSLRTVRGQDPDPHLVDARVLRAIREHLDREEHGGATVVNIEHVRAILGRRGR